MLNLLMQRLVRGTRFSAENSPNIEATASKEFLARVHVSTALLDAPRTDSETRSGQTHHGHFDFPGNCVALAC